MNEKILKWCGWSGIWCIALLGVGFVLAGFLPPPPPSNTVEQTAQLIIENKSEIRFGMILSMIASTLLMPFTAAITLHMRRIEGKFSALALIQLGMGTIFVLEFIYLIFFWQVATFRVDRMPELIQLLNDMAWVPFIGLSSTLVMQSIVFGVAILMDKRANPIFPRWLGYFNLWSALLFVPGSFNMFFLHGPLAWNGLLAFYLPVGVYALWMIVNSLYLVKAVDHQVQENSGIDHSRHSPEALAAEVETLRDELARLSAKISSV